MNLAKAAAYFLREASLNLLRSWKISALAVSTIAVSLFIGGSFLLVITNLSDLVEEWKNEAKVVVYLGPERSLAASDDLTERLAEPPWVLGVTGITAEEARRRFEESFPSVAELARGWDSEPLPASFEVAFDPLLVDPSAFDAWLEGIRAVESVAMVDDDRDWVEQLEAALRVMSAVAVGLGSILLAAAIFTIASVIRLTAYLYREEIAIMRLVGATEFFIRGPFYVEGLLQGLIGGLVALGALYVAYGAFVPSSTTLVVSAIAGHFLSVGQQLGLLGLGTASGLVGAVISLRREAV